jgi:hypothetical protein
MKSAKLIQDILEEEGENEGKIKPQTRLELSVNPSDGSLLTAPLSLIINTATDALYNDLHNMATGQPLTLFIPSAEDVNTGTEGKDDKMSYTKKSEAMSSLPYQQRRHILASRIARHIQSLSHISSLVASNLPNSATLSKHAGRASTQPNIYALAQIPPENELSQITQAASQALEHVRTSWVSADTAQDALYFHHDSLWKIRSHPHDILGSMDVLLKGRWKDLSRDVKLEDRYRDSEERAWGEEEMKERLRGVVRRKLILGEIGNPSLDNKNQNFRWNVTLEKDMVAVRLNYGKPRIGGGTTVYPLEARLTVLSEENPAPWSLLSVRIRTAVKTGESNQQLELSKEQMFGFHKICERAMMQEELRAKKLQSECDNDATKQENNDEIVARPLEKLLHLCHVFSLSWQMEILSSQAESLRKGTWSSQSSRINGENSDIVVSPVRFFSDDEQFDAGTGLRVKPLAYMAIHVWQVDDRNGKPKLGQLHVGGEEVKETFPTKTVFSNDEVAKRLTLEIAAIPSEGFEVSLSGGNEREAGNAYVIRNVKLLLSSLQDPFQLSVSDALLSAVIICSERRCHAVKEALLKTRKFPNTDPLRNKTLPTWLHLFVECGTISVGVNLSHDSPNSSEESKERTPVVLFRMACDSRTGRFIVTFPRAANLLRRLACNDPSASEVQFLRQVKSTAGLSSSVSDKRRASARARESTGRVVRESFQSLTRSMDILGRRVGVGGEWDDLDPNFAEALREKSIFEACSDVCVSLMSCAGIAAVYGVGALAIGVAGGSEALPDIGGGGITAAEGGGLSCMSIPPLSVIMNQQLVEHHTLDINGGKSTTMRLERELCGLTASFSNEQMRLHLLDIVTQVDSITSRKCD